MTQPERGRSTCLRSSRTSPLLSKLWQMYGTSLKLRLRALEFPSSSSSALLVSPLTELSLSSDSKSTSLPAAYEGVGAMSLGATAHRAEQRRSA
jgi:hypothetical protein